MSLRSGSRLGPYEIVSALGAGGMGEVYRARDARLHRDVAIKVLPEAFAADPDRVRRFQQEARAIAALNHPHICQIFDVGPAYLVLEYVDGAPLHGPLPIDTVVRVARQIASAIETAHSRGILHRDLKPANVLLTRAGDAKLLDFGLAKLIAPSDGRLDEVTRTIDGMIVGTAAYMSPEQAEGKPLDVRSDIFSFGVVLYEMVSGRRAFEGETPARVISALLRDEPPPLESSPLDRLVRTCLRKAPSGRFQTMAEVTAALERLPTKATGQGPSIAVLPFENMSGDKENEYFSDGLAEEIINALTRIPGLKVIARTSAFAFKGKHEDVRRIADVLGVTTILEGSVRKAGSRLRVTAQLITAADGSHLWSERYDREMTDVFAIQDEIAGAITEALQVTLVPSPARHRYTPKLPAHEALLRGRQFMLSHTVASQAPAKIWFERAMAIDPGYAEPHASLGLSHLLLSLMGMRSLKEATPLIRAEADQALALDPTESGPHFLLGAVAAAYEYDWKAALEHFAIATGGASVAAEAHWAYASLYLQPLGRHQEAVRHMEQAVERDPLNGFWRGVLASHLTHAERYDDAIDQANTASEIDATHLVPYTTLGEAYTATERWSEAARALEQACRIAPDFALTKGLLAGAILRLGDRDKADALVREMTDASQSMGRVLYHAIASELAQAADWFERAIERRDPFALVFANVPLLRPLRQTSRWPALARMMRMPE
jgi:eukaryotic-like serine/threonine-protein kinase